MRNPEIKDRDEDGLPELMVKFDRQSLIDIISTGDQPIRIGGWVVGIPFLGECVVKVK